MSLVVDVCAAGLADAATYSHGGRPLSSPAPSQPLPPPVVQRIADTPAAQSLASYIPLHPFLDQNKGIWNAGGEAAFESAMSAGRELHEKGKGGSCGGCGGGRVSHGIAWEANPIKGMNEGYRRQKSLRAKFATASTQTEKPVEAAARRTTHGFCSKTYRDANAKSPRPKCEHGRDKSQCKDYGTGSNCEHGSRKSCCKDCGTGHCEHGRPEGRCKDCGTGHCEHGRRRGWACRGCSMAGPQAHSEHAGRRPEGAGHGCCSPCCWCYHVVHRRGHRCFWRFWCCRCCGAHKGSETGMW
jgi:hypothetical protein